MNTTRSGPVTSSPLNKTWLRITGKESWNLTEATVFSCDWTDVGETNGPVGHHHVVYSYRVDGIIYTGRFVDYGTQDDAYFKRNDLFQVRYDPRKPARSYYPELRTDHNFRLIYWGIGAAVAAIALTISYLTGHLRG